MLDYFRPVIVVTGYGSVEVAKNALRQLDALQTDLQGDVKKLEGQKSKYRLRVGAYRLLFTLEKDLIFIHAVKDRKDVYRN